MLYFGNYIKANLGNNAISYKKRRQLGSECKLYVPNILDIKLQELDYKLRIGDKIVFEEVENNKLLSFFGLKNYLALNIGNSKVYIFDNHNVAFYFIGNFFLDTKLQLDLIHIDQHSDMYKPYFYPKNIDNLYDLEKYTFEGVNVGSYILPLQKLNFIKNIYQKRTEISVLELDNDLAKNSILNIDLDFWEDNMATSMYSLEKVKTYIGISPLVLIATSPFFIEQKKALNLVKALILD